MNSKLNMIFKRRSIRHYQDGNIAPETIQDLLKAAMAAPSACNKDPWRFVVVTSKSSLNRIADGLPNGQMLRYAAAGIVICGDQAQAHDGQLSYLIQDCSAATENLLLAASMLGLGACWLGSHPREDRQVHLRSVLEIPESIIPMAVVAIGLPAETKDARTRYDAAKVHYEKW